jgi:hypothetical protein
MALYALRDFAFATVMDVQVYNQGVTFSAAGNGVLYAGVAPIAGGSNITLSAFLALELTGALEDINTLANENKLWFRNVNTIDEETPADTTYNFFSVTKPITTLDSLTMSNITQEGPTKETRGGIYAEPIIRHKKTMRVEMEDVVLKPEALEVLFGATLYYENQAAEDAKDSTKIVGFGMTDRFANMLTLKGRTYVVDKEDGTRKWIDIVFKRFLPDSVVDLMMEAEGDLGVVNVAGELFPDACGEYFTIGRTNNLDCPDEDGLGTQQAL